MIIKCPSCQTELEVTEEMIGRNLRCSVCNAKFNLSDESSVRSQKKTTEQGFEPPHRDSPVMRNLKEIILIVFAIVCLTLAKVYSHELYERFWPGAKEYLNSKMLKDEIKDLQERFERQTYPVKLRDKLSRSSSNHSNHWAINIFCALENQPRLSETPVGADGTRLLMGPQLAQSPLFQARLRAWPDGRTF